MSETEEYRELWGKGWLNFPMTMNSMEDGISYVAFSRTGIVFGGSLYSRNPDNTLCWKVVTFEFNQRL